MIVHKLTPELVEKLRPVSDASLVGEEVMLRIGRTGFTLGYVPLPRAEWRSFPAEPMADPNLLLRLPQAAMFAAFEDDGSFVGQAAVMADAATQWARIIDIRVDAAHRRTGVASLLLESCQGFAEKQGMRGLSIHVTDTNPAACQFCEHRGFALQGMDRLALAYTDAERDKPLARRACQLFFYRTNQKG